MILDKILAPATNILGSYIEGVQQRKNIKAQTEANKQLADYTFNQNVQMWKAQNEYNTPLSQMERFKKAGLNPNLMYSQGSSGQAMSPPSYQGIPTSHMGKSAYVDPRGMLNDYMDLNSKEASINNQLTQGAILQEDLRGKKITNDVNAELLKSLTETRIKALSAQLGLSGAKTAFQDLQTGVLTHTYDSYIKFLNQDYRDRLSLNKSKLAMYSTDMALKTQQNALNEFKIEFMKNPKLDWSTLWQLVTGLK